MVADQMVVAQMIVDHTDFDHTDFEHTDLDCMADQTAIAYKDTGLEAVDQVLLLPTEVVEHHWAELLPPDLVDLLHHHLLLEYFHLVKELSRHIGEVKVGCWWVEGFHLFEVLKKQEKKITFSILTLFKVRQAVS